MKRREKDWIIARLLFAILRNRNKPDLWMRDVEKAIVYLTAKNGDRWFANMVDALAHEKESTK